MRRTPGARRSRARSPHDETAAEAQAFRLHVPDPGVSPRALEPVLGPPRCELADALVESHDGAAFAADELAGNGSGSRRDVENGVTGTGGDARDEEPAPARVLSERQERRVAVVGRAERSEERPRGNGLRHAASLCS